MTTNQPANQIPPPGNQWIVLSLLMKTDLGGVMQRDVMRNILLVMEHSSVLLLGFQCLV